MPWVYRSRINGVRHCLRHCLTFIFDGRYHSKCRVPASSIVKDLEVLEDRVGELNPSAPAFAVQEFDLHTAPERLDDGVGIN